MDKDMVPHNGAGLTPEIGDMITAAVHGILEPVLQSVAELLRNNTEAVQSLAAQEKIQTDRLNALEKEIRLQQLVTQAQVRYINDAVKNRARELLSKKDLQDDKESVSKMKTAIRKAVLSRYGISAIHDIPKHEYPVVMEQINGWNDMLVMMDISRAARRRTQ